MRGGADPGFEKKGVNLTNKTKAEFSYFERVDSHFSVFFFFLLTQRLNSNLIV